MPVAFVYAALGAKAVSENDFSIFGWCILGLCKCVCVALLAQAISASGLVRMSGQQRSYVSAELWYLVLQQREDDKKKRRLGGGTEEGSRPSRCNAGLKGTAGSDEATKYQQQQRQP